MEIVIDIPEEMYKEYISVNLGRGNGKNITYNLLNAIKKGTPLPEGHGRLIDEQHIIDRFKPVEKFEYWRIGLDGLINVLSDEPTIIEGSKDKMTREEAIEFILQSVKSDVDMAKVADAIETLGQLSNHCMVCIHSYPSDIDFENEIKRALHETLKELDEAEEP